MDAGARVDSRSSRRDWSLVPSDSGENRRPGAVLSSLAARLALLVWVIGLPIVVGTGLHAHGQIFHGLAVIAALAVLAAAAGKLAAWLTRRL